MKEFIDANGGLIQAVSLTVVCVNLVLSATKKILELVMNKTKSDVDNKAFAVVSKLADKTTKVIDWMSANRAHKD